MHDLDESAKESEAVKGDSKPESGRRKSARLSSKIQTASTPSGDRGDQHKVGSGKKAQSAGKKRNRQTSNSSLEEDRNKDVNVKMEHTADGSNQEMVGNDEGEGGRGAQNKAGDDESATPVVKKQSTGGGKGLSSDAATEEKTAKQSKPRASNSGGRVPRSRRSRGKSQPKKIKLESSEESSPSESQQQHQQQERQYCAEASQDKQPEQATAETGQENTTSDGKRVLRKRKQTTTAVASSSKQATTSKSGASESPSSESVPNSTPARQSKRLKVESDATGQESEPPLDQTRECTTSEGSKSCGELIVGISTSVAMVGMEEEGSSSVDRGSANYANTNDKTEELSKLDDKEPSSSMAMSCTSKDDSNVSGGRTDGTSSQMDSDGGQTGGQTDGTSSQMDGDGGQTGGQTDGTSSQMDGSGGQTGGQDDTPPTSGQPEQSPSTADSSLNVQSSTSSAVGTAIFGGDVVGDETTEEKESVEAPKKIDSSDLPPMIKVRTGMLYM